MAFILDDILLAPAKLACWLARTLREQAEAELTDESVIHQNLLELQTRFELGEISQEEFLDAEGALMHRLDEIRRYKESKQGPPAAISRGGVPQP